MITVIIFLFIEFFVNECHLISGVPICYKNWTVRQIDVETKEIAKLTLKIFREALAIDNTHASTSYGVCVCV